MTKHRILIVDDEKSILDTRALILRTLGYNVSTSEDGLDALLKLERDTLPDLIITDLNMPKMSGFQFLDVLRRRFPSIRVIASSGAYDSVSEIPGGLIADVFHAKTGVDPAGLWKLTADLLASPCPRAPANASRAPLGFEHFTSRHDVGTNHSEGAAYGAVRSRTAS